VPPTPAALPAVRGLFDDSALSWRHAMRPDYSRIPAAHAQNPRGVDRYRPVPDIWQPCFSVAFIHCSCQFPAQPRRISRTSVWMLTARLVVSTICYAAETIPCHARRLGPGFLELHDAGAPAVRRCRVQLAAQAGRDHRSRAKAWEPGRLPGVSCPEPPAEPNNGTRRQAALWCVF
jgi:hypothetical protein